MSFAKMKDQIAASRKELDAILVELDRLEELFVDGKDITGDGVFDIADRKKINDVRRNRDEKFNMLGKMEQRLEAAIHKAAGTKPPEGMTFEAMEIVGDDRMGAYRLFSVDRNPFVTQIVGWQTEVKLALNGLVDSMLSDTKNDGSTLGFDDAYGLAKLVLGFVPQAKAAVEVVDQIKTVVDVAYKASLPKKPSLRAIQKSWDDSLSKIDGAKAEALFDQLVKDFVKDKGMDPGEDMLYPVYTDEWNAMINEFRSGKMLPTGQQIGAVFMTEVIKSMPDSPWDMNKSAGTVTVYMDYDQSADTFKFKSGSMDDITDEVAQGLKVNPALFGEDKIVSLPAAITVVVSGSGWFDGLVMKCHRFDITSGGTGFAVSLSPINYGPLEQQSAIFAEFMKSKVYDQVKVSDIL